MLPTAPLCDAVGPVHPSTAGDNVRSRVPLMLRAPATGLHRRVRAEVPSCIRATHTVGHDGRRARMIQ